jgi:hypothetical protein
MLTVKLNNTQDNILWSGSTQQSIMGCTSNIDSNSVGQLSMGSITPTNKPTYSERDKTRDIRQRYVN